MQYRLKEKSTNVIMNHFIALFALSLLTIGCNQSDSREAYLENQIKELQHKIDNAYTPGFGNFMGSIQNHHNKLWYAGIHENWELASFEIHELEETFEAIENTYPDRDHTQYIPMIHPGLEAVENAISEQNPETFRSSYLTLTNACNTCHKATQHEFINITIPTAPSFTNQDYKSFSE